MIDINLEGEKHVMQLKSKRKILKGITPSNAKMNEPAAQDNTYLEPIPAYD
jgi:hypothetical protein